MKLFKAAFAAVLAVSSLGLGGVAAAQGMSQGRGHSDHARPDRVDRVDRVDRLDRDVRVDRVDRVRNERRGYNTNRGNHYGWRNNPRRQVCKTVWRNDRRQRTCRWVRSDRRR